LPDDALLTQREVAAVLRVAVSTVETWRRRGHPLKWATVGGGLVRYRAGDLREFLASTTKPRQPGPKPPSTDEAVRKPKVARKPSRRRADQPAASESELQEQRAR
jgi:phage terminase Nu1 subunit (DNA packaging protein)